MIQKLELFLGMLLATVTAAIAIYSAVYLMCGYGYPDLWECAGFFLAARVVLFMANPVMPLNDINVKFMSSERILWNAATIAVSITLIALKYCIALIF
jgi:hypothetical protein